MTFLINCLNDDHNPVDRFFLLQRFGLDRALAVPDLTSFSQSQFMTLDAVTLRDLEVTSHWGGSHIVLEY